MVVKPPARNSPQRPLRNLAVIALAFLTTLTPLPAAASQPSPAESSTIAALFTEYCRQNDKNVALCADGATVPLAVKFFVLKDYCGLTKKLCSFQDAPDAPPIAVYDHRRGRWSPEGGFGKERPIPGRFDLDFDRSVPTLRLRRHTRIAIAVSNTNPALFSARLGEAGTTDVDSLARAREFLGVLSGSLSGVLSAAGARAPGDFDELPRPPAPSGAVRYQELPNEKRAASPVDDALTQAEQELARIGADAGGVRLEVEAALGQMRQLIADIQVMERGWIDETRLKEADRRPKPITVSYRPSSKEWRRQWQSLVDLLPVFHQCTVIGTVAKEDTVEAFTARLKAYRALGCPWDIANPQTWPMPSPDADPENVPGRLVRLAAVFRDAATALNGLVKDVDLLKGVGALAMLIDQVHERSILDVQGGSVMNGVKTNEWTCTRTLHLASRIVILEEPLAGRWDKAQSYPVKLERIKATEGVATELGALDTRFRVERHGWSYFGFHIGAIIRTNVRSHEWDKTGPAGSQVITRVKDEGRGGRVAAFGTLRFAEPFLPALERSPIRPGVEIGAAIDTKTPGLFYGVNAEIFRIFRVGAGRVHWQVNQLVAGQVENGRIEDHDKVRTVAALQRGYYVSFAVALDSLSLFGK
jgi:hypothetical protein